MAMNSSDLSDPFAGLLAADRAGGPAPPRPVYSHDELIDEIIRDPKASKYELARRFGRGPAWIGQVMSSGMFQARLAERRTEIIDPALVATVEERLEAVARAATDVLLEASLTPDQAIKALAEAVKGLGMGGAKGPAVVQNFVAVVPQKADSFEEWARDHAPQAGVTGSASSPIPGVTRALSDDLSAPTEGPAPLSQRPGVGFAEVVAAESADPAGQ